MRRPVVRLSLGSAFAAAMACDAQSPTAPTPAAPPPIVVPGTAPPPAPSPATSPSGEPNGASDEAALSGRWISPSCGARAYERWITFDFPAFEAHDRVSPCPPKVACVWSGIVSRKGTADIAGDTIRLTFEDPATGPGVALPTSLGIDGGRPIERGNTDPHCVYERAPAPPLPDPGPR